MTQERTSPELPTLGDGVTLLETTDRATGALQSLVLDEVLLGNGPAAWVDTHGHGTTRPLARLAPSMRVLERIDIARAFTPWQHLSLLRDLKDEVSDETALVVLPEFDGFYRSDEVSDTEGERMLTEGISLVVDLVDKCEVSALLTRVHRDELSASIPRFADEVIEYELTRFGPRFVGDEFETLIYSVGDGVVQTTLAFWERVLQERYPSLTNADSTPEVSVRGSY